jgi:tyrosyl-tRNA synthetase
MELAKEIVTLIHGSRAAENSEVIFKQVFQSKKEPSEMPSFKVNGNNIGEVLLEIGYVKSKSEARRLISQGGISIDGDRVGDVFQKIPKKFVLKKGKRHFANICVV